MTKLEQPAPIRLSHKAAAVAQQMEDLENELLAAQERATEQENRAKVAEAQLGSLRAALAQKEEDLEFYLRWCTETETKFNVAAQILLDLTNRKLPAADIEAKRDNGDNGGYGAVAAALVPQAVERTHAADHELPAAVQ